jgi:hypothetical protein
MLVEVTVIVIRNGRRCGHFALLDLYGLLFGAEVKGDGKDRSVIFLLSRFFLSTASDEGEER